MSDLNTFVRGLIFCQNTEERIKCYDYIYHMLLGTTSYERDANLKQVQGIMKDLVNEQISDKLLVPIVYLIECAQKMVEIAEPVCDTELALFYTTDLLSPWNN
jgi:hypothetical protein